MVSWYPCCKHYIRLNCMIYRTSQYVGHSFTFSSVTKSLVTPKNTRNDNDCKRKNSSISKGYAKASKLVFPKDKLQGVRKDTCVLIGTKKHRYDLFFFPTEICNDNCGCNIITFYFSNTINHFTEKGESSLQSLIFSVSKYPAVLLLYIQPLYNHLLSLLNCLHKPYEQSISNSLCWI